MRKIHIDEEEWAARKLRLSTMQIVALGFMGIILAGGLLLWLPFSNRQPISFLDALFTAVTCVCVTGLVTVVPATQVYTDRQRDHAGAYSDRRTGRDRLYIGIFSVA